MSGIKDRRSKGRNITKNMQLKDINAIYSKDEAREIAIDWQNWASKKALSYGELADYLQYFGDLAEKFDLVAEFKENGII